MNEKTPERRTYTLLVELAGEAHPDARTLADTLERLLASHPGIGAACVSCVEGDATHATAVLAHLFMAHRHRH